MQIATGGGGLKNKAFTLIELLAVIVILAIIALIATPLVLNIIEKARKNAFLDSAYGIVDSARLYYTESLLDGTSGSAKIFSFDEENNELTFGGSKPKGGMVAVTKEGKVSIAIYNDTWCARKKENGSSIVLSKYEANKCTLDHIPDVTPDDPVTPSKGENIETVMTDEKAGENGSIRLDNSGNKRYAGSDPNNYVCFGMTGDTCDEEHLYRIIGTFEEGTKIIKNNFYSTSIAWDTSNNNNWVRPATLKTELNGSRFYENTSYIDETNRNYIANATWYTGGVSSNRTLADFEDSEKSSSSEGYIGLMSVIDFGYGSNNASCDRTTNLSSSNNACMSNNWLFNRSYHQWTITPYSGSANYVWVVRTGGFVNGYSANYSHGARPVLYLESGVKIKDGEGTSSNPYKLSK